MKLKITNISLLLIVFCFLTSMTTPYTEIIKLKQKEFNEYFTKRSLVLSSIPELEQKYKTRFSFIQKFEINRTKKRLARELSKKKLLEECDLITLKTGEEIKAKVTEIGTNEIKYIKCDNKTGPTYTIKKSDIFMIKYANGSKDFFGNEKPANQSQDELVNSDEVKTDGFAIASIASGLTGLLLTILLSGGILGILLAISGIVLGYVSKGRIKKSKGKLKGKGLANAGIIGGIIVVGLYLVLIALVL